MAWDIGCFEHVALDPDPDPLLSALALGGTEYTPGMLALGDTELETLFVGGVNITQQYATESGTFMLDDSNNYLTYGD